LQQTKSNKVLFEKFIDFARLVGISLRFLLALLEACYLLIGKSSKFFHWTDFQLLLLLFYFDSNRKQGLWVFSQKQGVKRAKSKKTTYI
jgi:hypothetical protein